MAFKTTLGPKGIVTEKTSKPFNEVKTEGVNRLQLTQFATGSVTCEPSMTNCILLAACTVTLPEITSEIVGIPYWFYNVSGSASVLTGANSIHGPSCNSQEVTLDFSAGNGNVFGVTLLPLSSSQYGFAWHIVDGEAVDN